MPELLDRIWQDLYSHHIPCTRIMQNIDLLRTVYTEDLIFVFPRAHVFPSTWEFWVSQAFLSPGRKIERCILLLLLYLQWFYVKVLVIICVYFSFFFLHVAANICWIFCCLVLSGLIIVIHSTRLAPLCSCLSRHCRESTSNLKVLLLNVSYYSGILSQYFHLV